MATRAMTISVILIGFGVVTALAWLVPWWPDELPTAVTVQSGLPPSTRADEIPWERRMARYGPYPHYEPPPPPPAGADAVASEQSWAKCGKLPDPIPVTIIGGSLDYLPTMRFTNALRDAIRDAPPLYLTDLAPCGLVVYIPTGVNDQRYAGTTEPEDPVFGAIDPEDLPERRIMISYRVNVYQEGGPSLGSFVGACWLDEAAKCGTGAAEDVLAAALKYRSW